MVAKFKISGKFIKQMMARFSGIDMAWIFLTFIDDLNKNGKIHAITHYFYRNEYDKFEDLMAGIKKIERDNDGDGSFHQTVFSINAVWGTPEKSANDIEFIFDFLEKNQLKKELTPAAWIFFEQHLEEVGN